MKTLYQFSGNIIERGIQIEVTFCAYTWKDVCKLMDISMYTAKNYWLRLNDDNFHNDFNLWSS